MHWASQSIEDASVNNAGKARCTDRAGQHSKLLPSPNSPLPGLKWHSFPRLHFRCVPAWGYLSSTTPGISTDPRWQLRNPDFFPWISSREDPIGRHHSGRSRAAELRCGWSRASLLTVRVSRNFPICLSLLLRRLRRRQWWERCIEGKRSITTAAPRQRPIPILCGRLLLRETRVSLSSNHMQTATSGEGFLHRAEQL